MFHLATLVLALLAPSVLTFPSTPYAAKRSTEQHQEKDQSGAVASESSVCSRIGVDLIRDGGNAADAVSILQSADHLPV